MIIMVLKIIGIILIVAVLFFMISDINDLLDEGKINGEIIKAHATPEYLIEGQPENFEIVIKNIGTYSNFMIEVQRDSQVVAYYNFKFNDATIKIINLKSTLPPISGKYIYKYTLYPGIIGGTSIPVSSVIETRRIYSLKDLSDDDNDGLRYFEEIEIGTDPDNADTDGDGIPDNLDTFPVNAKETSK
jgi:hypothetical protein